jgi:AcrR family transcriptional regulator
MAPSPTPSEVPHPAGGAARIHPEPAPPIFSTTRRDRLLSGAVRAVGEHGYPGATVAQIISASHVSRRTFYEHFADKPDCVLAAYDRALQWLGEQVAKALVGVDSWQRGVQVAVGSILTSLEADLHIARLCTIEVLAVGGAGVARHEESIARLAALLRAGRAPCPWGTELPLSLEETVVGGALWLIGSRARPDDADPLRELAPELTYFLLAPYLGIHQARREAFGEPFPLRAVERG